MTTTTTTPDVRYLPFDEWQTRARDMRARADRSRASRVAVLRRVCRTAGIEPMLIHNATVSASRGEPWRGVDPSQLRRAARLQRDLYAASRIVDRWHARNRPKFDR